MKSVHITAVKPPKFEQQRKARNKIVFRFPIYRQQ